MHFALCIVSLPGRHHQRRHFLPLPSNIATETTGLTAGTSISFTIDTPGQVQVSIVGGVQNFGDPGTSVATLTQSYPLLGQSGIFPAQETIFWNGLWLIGGDQARIDGTYQFSLTLSTTAGTFTTPVPPSPQVMITSVDIHNVAVSPTLDSGGNPIAPYVITYSLAKQAAVTVTVINSSNTLVRTVIANKTQYSEAISSVTLNWDGNDNSGAPVPIGLYTVQINATDPTNNDKAIQRSRQVGVVSLAGAQSDPQKLFADNVYVYPNPVRHGPGIFNVLPGRDGATSQRRISTITGTLVLDQDITSQLPFPWHAVNQSGQKVGRGLYYYVVRENDPEGTLQTTKKMVVLP